VADTTRATPEPRYRVPCEFCGSAIGVLLPDLIGDRQCCEDCKKRLASSICLNCGGAGYDDADLQGDHYVALRCGVCHGEGLKPDSGCPYSGNQFCDQGRDCLSCGDRMLERAMDQAEAMGEHWRVQP
jgi:hypothetical protein